MTASPINVDGSRRALRVGVVDDHALLGESLAAGLSQRGFNTLALQPLALDQIEAFVQQNQLDVLLLDLDLGHLGKSLPCVPGVAALGCTVVVVTGHTSEAAWGECVEAGAKTVVSKALGFDQLVNTIARVLDNDPVVVNAEREELLSSLRTHRERERERLEPFMRLSARERDVLYELLQGRSAEQIAQLHFVSVTTVRSHIRAILSKLDVNSQLAAVSLAVKNDWFANR